MESTSKRVALYGRVSTPGQALRDLSIPEQFAALKAFCEARGWAVAGEYSDAGLSGGSVHRVQFQAMLKRAHSKEHPFDLILTRDAARFGRGDEDPAVRSKLRDAGVAVDNIESPSGDMYAPLTPGGKFAERVQWAANVMQREEIPARVIASQRKLARDGGLPGRQGTVYGYRSVWLSTGGKPKRIVEVDPVKSEIVREMFRQFLVDGSIKSVTRWLNESHVEPPGNGKRAALQWYDTTVRGILTNETLRGQIVYGRVRKQKIEGSLTGAKRNVKNTTAEIVRTAGAFPAIIDPDTFGRVQAILDGNTRALTGKANPGNTLRGIGKCSVCGWHLAHQRNSSNGRWYYMCGRVKTHKARSCDPACKGNLDASYVDRVVEMFVRNTLTTPHYAATIKESIRRYNEAARGFKGLDVFASLDATIGTIEATVANLVTQVKRTGSASLADALVAEEERLAQARRGGPRWSPRSALSN